MVVAARVAERQRALMRALLQQLRKLDEAPAVSRVVAVAVAAVRAASGSVRIRIRAT